MSSEMLTTMRPIIPPAQTCRRYASPTTCRSWTINSKSKEAGVSGQLNGFSLRFPGRRTAFLGSSLCCWPMSRSRSRKPHPYCSIKNDRRVRTVRTSATIRELCQFSSSWREDGGCRLLRPKGALPQMQPCWWPWRKAQDATVNEVITDIPHLPQFGAIRAATGASAAIRGSSNRLVSASHLSDQLFGIRVGTPACLASVSMDQDVIHDRFEPPPVERSKPVRGNQRNGIRRRIKRSSSTGSRSSLTWRSPAGSPCEFSPDDRAGNAASELATPHLPIPASETKSLRPQGRAGRGVLPLDQRTALAAHPRWPAPVEGSLPPLHKRGARALMFKVSAAT